MISSLLQSLARLLIIALAVFIAAYVLPGVSVTGFLAALITAVILGVVNAFVRPLLVIITLPLTVVTFGLFIFVINALLILLVDVLVDGFAVANFWWALLFSLLVSLISAFLHSLERPTS